MPRKIPISLPAAAAAVAILWGAAATGAEVRVAGSADAAAVRAIEAATGPSAVAIGRAAGQAAFAAPDPEQDGRSVVQLFAAEGLASARVLLPGVVRALLFDPEGTALFAIQFRPAKKREGDAELVRIDVAQGKPRGVMRLPASATALDYWAARESLVIAGHNEIRTVRLAGLRSGPLYRVPGPNSAVACLAGSDIVLVAQDEELLLLDLGDPPGDESMPVRERLAAPARVVGLAADPEGTSALALLADGRVFRVTFGPLELEPAGSAQAVVASGKSATRDPVVLAPLVPVEEGAAEVATTSPAEPQVPPETPAPAAVPVDAAPPAGAAAETLADAPPSPAPLPPAQELAPAPAAAPPPAGEPQLWGTIDGPSSDAVVEVVLFGPDSVLREARRVRPAADGVWTATGLAPGRYQVQLAAGGNRILVSEPRVVLVEIGSGGSVQAQPFRVLRAYEP